MQRSLWFEGPGQVSLRDEQLSMPGPGEVLVETVCSAISAGTELLLYRGQVPEVDTSAQDSISGALTYPTRYGYAAVGRIIQVGAGVEPWIIGREVFTFAPHGSHFTVPAYEVHQLPAGMDLEAACFLPNMETAINLVQDGRPMLGERVAVLGCGVVGLLTLGLLKQFPLNELAPVEKLSARRARAESWLGIQAHSPDSHIPGSGMYDLVFELSGNPAALDLAIHLSSYTGRIVVGSWYGSKRYPVDLGGDFHRKRLQIISSQVSTIAPELSGRWDKARRFDLVRGWLERLQPQRLIDRRYPIERAAEAYALLDQDPGAATQAIFTY